MQSPRTGAALAVAALLFLSACTTSKKSTVPPPPRGKSIDEYLAEPKPKPLVKPPGTNDADAMKIHFIDVGQGAAFLLEFPCGAALIDTGGEKNAQFDSARELFAYLDAFFARRPDLEKTLDVLYISHPHIDHTRSALDLVARYRVRNLVDNGMKNKDIGGRPQIGLHEWVAEKDGKVGYRAIKVEDIPSERGLTDETIDPIHGCGRVATDPLIRVLWGQVIVDRASFGENPNDHSVVVRVDYGRSSVLFAGDLEKAGIARMSAKYNRHRRMLDVDIYQVAHHGSKNSSAQHLIRWVSPEVAVVSMGAWERNLPWTARKFGHPTKIAIEHLTHRVHGVRRRRPHPVEVMVGLKGAWKERESVWEKRVVERAVYATGWDGHVVVSANRNGWIEVKTQRKPAVAATASP